MGIYFLAVIYLWFLCGYFYVVLLLFRDPRFREAVAMHPFVLFFINMAMGPVLFIKSIRKKYQQKRELHQQNKNPGES